MTPCRVCRHPVSNDAFMCPSCGAPYPARGHWDGWGYEYKSRVRVLGLPLLHVSFKYRPNKRPVPAVGIIAIGQFAVGVVSIAQFGVGLLSVGQLALAGVAVAQFAAGYSCLAQFGYCVDPDGLRAWIAAWFP